MTRLTIGACLITAVPPAFASSGQRATWNAPVGVHRLDLTVTRPISLNLADVVVEPAGALVGWLVESATGQPQGFMHLPGRTGHDLVVHVATPRAARVIRLDRGRHRVTVFAERAGTIRLPLPRQPTRLRRVGDVRYVRTTGPAPGVPAQWVGTLHQTWTFTGRQFLVAGWLASIDPALTPAPRNTTACFGPPRTPCSEPPIGTSATRKIVVNGSGVRSWDEAVTFSYDSRPGDKVTDLVATAPGARESTAFVVAVPLH